MKPNGTLRVLFCGALICCGCSPLPPSPAPEADSPQSSVMFTPQMDICDVVRVARDYVATVHDGGEYCVWKATFWHKKRAWLVLFEGSEGKANSHFTLSVDDVTRECRPVPTL